MPVYNAAGTLAGALESVRGQSFTSFEVLAVDDGSTDDSGLILEAAAREDRRIRVISQGRQGICAALQRGCAAARGGFIARMDADDWMAPERLARQWQFLQDHPGLGLVSCLVSHGGRSDLQAGYATHVDWINSLLTPEEISLRRFVESPMAHPSVMFRRALLERFGGYEAGDFPEDYELWLRWLEAGVPFGKVNVHLLTWNDPPGRLSRMDARYRAEAFYRLKCHYLARWLRRGVDPKRAIWLWGSGRITRQRFGYLEDEGIPIRGFIDVDRKKAGRKRDGRPVVTPSALPDAADAFVVVGVAVRGAREFILGQLKGAGRVEGADFVLAA